MTVAFPLSVAIGRAIEKDDVKTTLGRDGKALVAVVEPDDHDKMIKLFIYKT